ncbi:glycoside hydrolase family 95-like protein [Bacteroides sp. NGMCC 1.200775]|jgi:alpha-L-fucosidase 2|uniref:glycosyl hydrolase family 95 catalytic domain-containing protein n=1 Tax=Bacteroides sp. NGMCC 1.200775 TaxID=3044577 RepID=UPI003463B0AD
MKIKLLLLLCCGLWGSCSSYDYCPVTPSESDLVFTGLARSWDEAMPLGNATVGALVWQRDSSLRLSLDRTDLWDLRPVDSLSGDNFRFSWVKEHIRTKDYLPVQKKLDWPYDMNPAPSKIPGAAIEFPLEKIGAPTQVRLYLNNALCEANWADGTQMQTFVHATEPVGWFVFRNLKTPIEPSILTPVYNKTKPDGSLDPVSGQDLHRLGYQQGETVREGNRITYHQKGYGDFWYDVVVCWKQEGETLYGTWSVTSSLSGEKAAEKAEAALQRGLKQDYQAHLEYWDKYWAQSSVTLPDSILQKQYQNEMYKFASTTREHSYPISLQAVWTADNGKLPPWKGDYHHDLNTQLSYWPAYTGNHLTEGMGYLNTLWNQRDTYKRYTRQYFGTEGMNIPGVCTLTGEPMGGWIQYSMSQTVAAWLAQHFYLHWKYSADRTFLKERAYPFLKDVAIYLEQVSEVTPEGVRKLEFSSSPEVFDNSLQAWFSDMTNYDLAMMHFLFKAAAELAHELNLTDESSHWAALEAQLPDYDVDEEGCLTFAKGYPYNESHRHFSHAMAIHPMGLIDWSDGEKSQHIIRATLKRLDEVGPDYWTGYSYSWLANMKARAFDGKGAAQALRTFAECFCLKNTFHANGDQTKSGKSRFTYRPFTLEGNFAFASGIQEMLLQSHTGTIRIFPALPEEWKDVSFEGLRAMGAFLVYAQMEGGEITRVRIYSEKGGMLKIARPGTLKPDKNYTLSGPDILNIDTQADEWIELKP